MTMIIKDNAGNVTEEREFTKEEISTFTLCSINGCSQSTVQAPAQVSIGFYH